MGEIVYAQNRFKERRPARHGRPIMQEPMSTPSDYLDYSRLIAPIAGDLDTTTSDYVAPDRDGA